MTTALYPVDDHYRLCLASGMDLEQIARGATLTPLQAQRFRIWKAYVGGLGAKVRKPLVLLIGGATNTGKSTLAADIAYRLGIRQVLSTDSIREVMRQRYPEDDILKEPSYRAGEHSADTFADRFIKQAGSVWRTLLPIVERCEWGGESIAVEGVHVLPSVVCDRHGCGPERWVFVITSLRDPAVHEERFLLRSKSTHFNKPPERYLVHFDGVRRANELFKRLGKLAGIPIIDTADYREAREAILCRVFHAVQRELGNV